MNQRHLDDKQKVISKPITKNKKVVDPPKAERIMFDKAEQAEKIKMLLILYEVIFMK
jgi:hypothetical protein